MKHKKGHNQLTGQDMTALGAKGGRGNKGKPATIEKCRKAGQAVWVNLSPEERSEINRKRAHKAWVTRRASKKQ